MINILFNCKNRNVMVFFTQGRNNTLGGAGAEIQDGPL